METIHYPSVVWLIAVQTVAAPWHNVAKMHTLRSSRKITYSALTAAIAVSCMLIAQFVPLKAPLFVCALCYYIAMDRCGTAFGLLSIAVSIVLIALMGFVDTAIFVLLIFAPYGVISYFMRNLTYNKAWHIALRVLISTAFANIVLAVCYFLAHVILPEIDIDKILGFVGGYFVLALFASLFFIATDFFFRQFCLMFKKMLR